MRMRSTVAAALLTAFICGSASGTAAQSRTKDSPAVIHAIERIKRQSSGNDLVRLRSGRELNIGRKFKEALDQFDVIN